MKTLKIFPKEDERRGLNILFDSKPSMGHRFNFKLALPYIINKRVLDIGCWSGQFEQLAVKYTKKIVGIDPKKEAVEYAQRIIPKADFQVGWAEKLPFPNKSFDTVIFCDVIEHLPKSSENKSLREINGVLRSKGHLLLSTPNKNPISILLDPAYFPIGHRHYSTRQLTELLYKNGFKIISIYQAGGLARLLTASLEMLFKHFLKRKLKFPNFIQKIVLKEYYKKGFAQNYIICQKSL